MTDEQAETIAFLESGKAFAGGGAPRRIDTHAASVFLTGERAWKLKRAVRFGYLDFSTAGKRRQALDTELRLNRRTAPELYLAVTPVTREDGGGLAIGGAGPAVDWLLEMRRFPDGALLSEIADRGELDEATVLRLADRIHGFHADAPPDRSTGGAARMRGVVDGNGESLAAFPEAFEPARAEALVARQRAEIDAHAALLDERARAGRVRHVHGDLHLANIAMIDGAPTPFDCLEFDAALATIDTLYDLAFLLMDLWRRGLRAEANAALNRCLDLAPEDEDGIVLMPLFLSIRATVRAHVLAARHARTGGDEAALEDARDCLGLAERLLEPRPARLVVIGGLSGTGKSTIARRVGWAVGRPPGARILRSDVLRKRFAGVAPEERLPPESYGEESHARVYGAMMATAEALLAAGWSTLADAVFARPEERRAIADAAARAGAGFDGLWLEAPAEVRIARIGGRTGDASDADAAVAARQEDYAVGDLGGWHRVAATGSIDEAAARALAVLGGPSG